MEPRAPVMPLYVKAVKARGLSCDSEYGAPDWFLGLH
jgi:hypothetical protein